MDTAAFTKISYGLYIISTQTGGRRSACVINTCAQVTSDPARISVTLAKSNFTHGAVLKSGMFAVCPLSRITPIEHIRAFGFRSSANVDKFDGYDAEKDALGLPFVALHSIAVISARVEKTVDIGTHTIIIAAVVDTKVLEDGEPMTYAYYHSVKKGRTPAAAPSFISANAAPRANTAGEAARYVCDVCGYVYDESTGAQDAGVAPGTKWHDVPEDFTCPVCGAPKSRFSPVTA